MAKNGDDVGSRVERGKLLHAPPLHRNRRAQTIALRGMPSSAQSMTPLINPSSATGSIIGKDEERNNDQFVAPSQPGMPPQYLSNR